MTLLPITDLIGEIGTAFIPRSRGLWREESSFCNLIAVERLTFEAETKCLKRRSCPKLSLSASGPDLSIQYSAVDGATTVQGRALLAHPKRYHPKMKVYRTHDIATECGGVQTLFCPREHRRPHIAETPVPLIAVFRRD